MLCLGLGNGAVFQMVPQRFAREIGLVTGVVGAIGGIGGFILPNVLGQARAVTGSFATGFVILTVLAAGAIAAAARVDGHDRRLARILARGRRTEAA